MCFVSFFQSRNIRSFDNNVSFNLITHALYPILIVQNYIEFITFMLIINLDQHQIILGKF